MTPPSPCIRICTLDAADECLGCGRTLAEITGWLAATDAERRRIAGAAAIRRDRRRGAL
ncbi:DUF1289 domain-containing protein [Sphingomonas naphthae]|uniref:DUF1289 domain-containing protein n=1 Tax=Sphingomonas naphthae TaxID=1813468 RepID=A0ABY7TPJ3_9SPHN|nr:DUF1289 domain-containing protein [Sphingomonas naphthae]WCT75154.1 DUF1289 domain-containing protein [Sphingomonas naphthae]